MGGLGFRERWAKLGVHELLLNSPAIELIRPSGLTSGPGAPSHPKMRFTRG